MIKILDLKFYIKYTRFYKYVGINRKFKKAFNDSFFKRI